MCGKVLEAPDVAEPLGTLCDMLSLAHGVAVTTGGPDCGHFTPLQQCRTFYLWSLAWGGVALPLLASARFEAQLRRRLGQQGGAQQAQQEGQQQGQQQHGDGGAAWGVLRCALRAAAADRLGRYL